MGKRSQPLQTCSRPPLRSTDSFGMDSSGPGLPLCLHHFASRLAVAQHGPIKIRLLSLRLVLRRKSFTLSRNDDPRITPEKKRNGEGYRLESLLLKTQVQARTTFLKSINLSFVKVFFFSWFPPVLCHSDRILVMKQVYLIHIPNKAIFAKTF